MSIFGVWESQVGNPKDFQGEERAFMPGKIWNISEHWFLKEGDSGALHPSPNPSNSHLNQSVSGWNGSRQQEF